MASITCLELAGLAAEAGVPPGVLNVITGLGAEAGAPLWWVPGCREKMEVNEGLQVQVLVGGEGRQWRGCRLAC